MTATDHAVSLVHVAARAASDKLAQHIVAFDVSDSSRSPTRSCSPRRPTTAR